MGLSTKQVTGDLPAMDWPAGKTAPPRLGALELPKLPPPARRQPPAHQQTEPLKCPRCGSTNTKFCYYNNYNKSQPRHFCKSCKRHWTKGGTLRNVPVGGGRKNKRPKIPAAAKAAGNRDRADAGNQKGLPDALYSALIKSPLLLHGKSDISVNIISSGLDSNNDLFQFSNLSALQMGSSLNPMISIQESLNAFGPYRGNLDSIEESTITSANNIPSSSGGPWPGPFGDGSLGLPDYWNWNEIGGLASSDHLDISWGDEDTNEIKP